MGRVVGRFPIPALVAGVLGITGSPARADSCNGAVEIASLPFSAAASTCGAGNGFTNDSASGAVCPDLPTPYGGEDRFYKLKLEQGNRISVDLTMPPGATGDLA